MTTRLDDRLRKVENAVGSRSHPLHMVVCYDEAEIAAAKRFLGDRFGDLLFVSTGVPRRFNEAERREKWLEQAKHHSVAGRPRS